MAFDKQTALADIDRVLTHKSLSPTDGLADKTELGTLLAGCVERWARPNSAPVRQLRDWEAKGPSYVHHVLAIVRALRAEIVADALRSFEEIIHADVFADLLAQADYLNDEGFRRPAAVLAGGAMEEHLRQLARKHGVDTIDSNGKPHSAATLNAELKRAAAYTKVEHAQVDAWQKLRNSAAHGEADFEKKYEQGEIRRMVGGVRDFVAKYPA